MRKDVPLLGLALWLLLSLPLGMDASLRLLAAVTVATLVGSAATLFALYALLAPISLASRSLRGYLREGRVPDLPTGFPDRAGELMADVQHSIDQFERLDRAVGALEELSRRDHLTGVHNRRACEERLAEDVARAARGGGALTLALLDIDGFKSLNDGHGHPAGDACLKHVAAVLEGNVREGDWLGRWGGDEFMLVLWGVRGGLEESEALERIRRAVREHPARLPHGGGVRLTLSVGACRHAGRETARALFARTDGALYQAKERGRDRLVYEG